MLDFKDETPALPGYEEDFALWLDAQAALLRNGQFAQLDIENLIEELNGMSRHERHALKSRLEVLIQHLLKCQFQPERKTPSWTSTIIEQRARIHTILEDSPSLLPQIAQFANKAYAIAVRKAATETGLPSVVFPAALPYVAEQLLDEDFLP
ncbi:DUF29 domain-containing protein [Massilia sp. BJB1822]|uniref:DUF29 domain-containing protein n=1 Tax=Massilia sp. BJB1822 TaxID=2744470 RepID=UPI001593D825|nr:DUF29 domain-containing protein [Massilia sp. BJB1822]NVD98458.1 DUF29 domain-containing protein [Massilia sp. BJB1822]